MASLAARWPCGEASERMLAVVGQHAVRSMPIGS
jgi:hypothetical protein